LKVCEVKNHNFQGQTSLIISDNKNALQSFSQSEKNVENTLFEFHGKKSARIFHLDPVRVFLVQNIDDKWLFWGKVYMQSQTISKVLDQTGQWLNNEWQTGRLQFACGPHAAISALTVPQDDWHRKIH
jgi:hypothetical protein